MHVSSYILVLCNPVEGKGRLLRIQLARIKIDHNPSPYVTQIKALNARMDGFGYSPDLSAMTRMPRLQYSVHFCTGTV